MEISTIFLTNESGTSIIKVPSVATVKLEPIDNSVLVLSYSKGDICIVVVCSNTSPFLFRSIDSIASKPCGDHSCSDHLQCTNNSCDYYLENNGDCNCT